MKKGTHARRFAEWTTHLTEDADFTFTLTGDDKVKTPGRRILAAALSYILTQLDLIPDHERAGAIDDAMVLRIAHGLAAEHTSQVAQEASARIARLTNEEDELHQFLGEATYGKLRRYVQALQEKEVRGRSVDQILGDARTRTEMKRELEQRLKAMKPTLVDDDAAGDAIEVAVKSYLEMKLK